LQAVTTRHVGHRNPKVLDKVAQARGRPGIATAPIGELRRVASQCGAYVIFVQADRDDGPAIAPHTRLGQRGDVMHIDIAPAQGVAAMRGINAIILRSLFIPVFMGSSVLSRPLAAGLVHAIGVFGCTVAFDVPLNNVLAGVDAAISQAASAWADDLQRWTRRNHVRTIAATTSCTLYVGAVAAS
jgi:uncharacterized membrane protein